MLKLRRTTSQTLQGAPPGCDSPRMPPLASCTPSRIVLHSSARNKPIDRTARPAVVNKTPIESRKPTSVQPWAVRKASVSSSMVWIVIARPLQRCVSFLLSLVSQSVSQLFHGPAPRSPLHRCLSVRGRFVEPPYVPPPQPRKYTGLNGPGFINLMKPGDTLVLTPPPSRPLEPPVSVGEVRR